MAKTNKSGTMIFYVPDFLLYTNSYEMSPTENFRRNTMDKASWGWGPNRENFRRNTMDKASWGWGPNREISEEIPRTKQVGVGRRQGTMISI